MKCLCGRMCLVQIVEWTNPDGESLEGEYVLNFQHGRNYSKNYWKSFMTDVPVVSEDDLSYVISEFFKEWLWASDEVYIVELEHFLWDEWNTVSTRKDVSRDRY